MSDNAVTCCAPALPRAPVTSPSLARLSPLAFALGAGAWTLGNLAAHPLSEWLAFGVLPVARDSRLGVAAAFFVYEVPRVLLLLTGIVFLIGVVNTYCTLGGVRSLLAGRGEGVGTVLAALLLLRGAALHRVRRGGRPAGRWPASISQPDSPSPSAPGSCWAA